MSRSVVSKVRPAALGVLLVGMVVVIAACGPSRGFRGGRSSSNITRSQLQTVPISDAYTVVRLLRPRWLTPRTQATPADPTPIYPRVYVDELPYGPLEFLTRIPSTNIERIEFISAINATTLWGTDHMGGVIRVTTR